LQDGANQTLLLRRELLSLRGQIEHVDCLLPFGIDERYFYIAIQAGKCGTDLVQQTGMILRDDFDEGALGRSVVIEMDAFLNGYFRLLRRSFSLTVFQQWIEG